MERCEMIYISKEDVLAGYLEERGLLKTESSYKIHYCRGGVSCTVAYVEIDGRPMIIKQALEQLTAGGWMYIGPQGIVHGTFNTLLNAGRLKLGIPQVR